MDLDLDLVSDFCHIWPVCLLILPSLKDEAGVAAYKTVELDDSLGGAPVQFREVRNCSGFFVRVYSA